MTNTNTSAVAIRDTILSDYFEHYDLPDGQHGPAAHHLRDCIDDALEKLRPQWRDIADAPKDGTWILTLCANGKCDIQRWCVSMGEWGAKSGEGKPVKWQPLPEPVSRQQDGTT